MQRQLTRARGEVEAARETEERRREERTAEIARVCRGGAALREEKHKLRKLQEQQQSTEAARLKAVASVRSEQEAARRARVRHARNFGADLADVRPRSCL